MYELHDVYVGGKDKLPTRIVVYKCTEEKKQKRLHDRAIRERTAFCMKIYLKLMDVGVLPYRYQPKILKYPLNGKSVFFISQTQSKIAHRTTYSLTFSIESHLL
ncbi:hypothetical protein COE15_26510 [Bacillus cereus]|nr:hypothetical protein CN288_25055 [Bacillus sp. AFS023182]PGX90363.1 hypothetical protein COE15_26510 [Bacillus cereus]